MANRSPGKKIIIEAEIFRRGDSRTSSRNRELREGRKKTRRNIVRFMRRRLDQSRVGMRPRRTTRDLYVFYGKIISGRILMIILQLARDGMSLLHKDFVNFSAVILDLSLNEHIHNSSFIFHSEELSLKLLISQCFIISQIFEYPRVRQHVGYSPLHRLRMTSSSNSIYPSLQSQTLVLFDISSRIFRIFGPLEQGYFRYMTQSDR